MPRLVFLLIVSLTATAVQGESCEDLFLPPNSDGVCGTSQPCDGIARTHAEAKAHCESQGMRLCTAHEMLTTVADTSCYSYTEAWTSTSCSLTTKATDSDVIAAKTTSGNFQMFNLNNNVVSTHIVALTNNLDIYHNSVLVASGLMKGDVHEMGAAAIGDELSATCAGNCFSAISTTTTPNQQREWHPATLTSQTFSQAATTTTMNVNILAPSLSGTVTVTVGTAVVETAQIAEGGVVSLTLTPAVAETVLVSSTVDILVSSESEPNALSTPLIPAGLALYGIPSTNAIIAPTQNNLDYSVACTDGETMSGSVAHGSTSTITGTDSNYQGRGCVVTATNNEEFSVSSVGVGVTSWARVSEFATEFVVPVESSFVAVVSDQGGVVTVTQDDLVLGSFRIDADGASSPVFHGYFERQMKPGARLTSTVPCFAVFDGFGDEEAILFGVSYVNECLVNNGGCDQICVDDDDGFHCECNDGFELEGLTTCQAHNGMITARHAWQTSNCFAATIPQMTRCCTDSRCQHLPCQNGNQALLGDDCVCFCDPGYGGALCDRCDANHFGDNCETYCEEDGCGGEADNNALYLKMSGLESELSAIRFQNAALIRTMILWQTTSEQRVRSEGGSGLTHVRQVVQAGERAHTWSQDVGFGFMNMHDHSNNRETVGLAELAVVLNGVEFWTRHNDYGLAQPSKTSTDYHKTDPLTFPAVPPSVLSQPDVASQVAEMREYFRAFKLQDPSIREYRPYFKPVLTYLEGAWILDTDTLDRPFDSDRHVIEAETWAELHTKTRFLLNSGAKNINENIPYLPSCIREVINSTTPVFANWEYRIVNHMINGDVPTDRFHLAGDNTALFQKTNFPTTTEDLLNSRRARFTLNALNQSEPADSSRYHYHFLDEIMQQVPGKDNYPADLRDRGVTALVDGVPSSVLTINNYNGGELNSGYYSRVYSEAEADAVGRTLRKRSFHDPNLFAAMSSQEKVSGLENEIGTRQRWSYAIPLEIVYTTPLTEWNPYDIEYKTDEMAATEVDGNGRDGTFENPFNGARRNVFYRTPSEFFSGATADSDAADTDQGQVWVLDSAGVKRSVRASGHWVFFPEIEGVGNVRQRWPIAPLHHANHASWKELKATIALESQGPTDAKCFILTVGSSDHEHTLCISAQESVAAIGGTVIRGVTSTLGGGHTHDVDIVYNLGSGTYQASLVTGHGGHGFTPQP